MIDDPLLHLVFLDNGGLSVIVDILKTALIENDYRNYPDSIVPIISILKNVCLFHSSCRQELVDDVDVYFCVLRGALFNNILY